MTANEFMGMLISAIVVLAGLCATIVKPLVANTKQMTELNMTMQQLIQRMDKQDKDFSEHLAEFESYKEHVKQSQKKQWDEIDLHHDKLIEHRNEIEQLKRENNETEQRKD